MERLSRFCCFCEFGVAPERQEWRRKIFGSQPAMATRRPDDDSAVRLLQGLRFSERIRRTPIFDSRLPTERRRKKETSIGLEGQSTRGAESDRGAALQGRSRHGRPPEPDRWRALPRPPRRVAFEISSLTPRSQIRCDVVVVPRRRRIATRQSRPMPAKGRDLGPVASIAERRIGDQRRGRQRTARDVLRFGQRLQATHRVVAET